VVSYPIYNLELAGWDRQSTWGWDPALETLYAQLTRNESDVEADVHGPEIWISPPTFPRITDPVGLAKVIGRATGAGAAAARAAMNNSLPDGDHPFRLPEIPLGEDPRLARAPGNHTPSGPVAGSGGLAMRDQQLGKFYSSQQFPTGSIIGYPPRSGASGSTPARTRPAGGRPTGRRLASNGRDDPGLTAAHAGERLHRLGVSGHAFPGWGDPRVILAILLLLVVALSVGPVLIKGLFSSGHRAPAERTSPSVEPVPDGTLVFSDDFSTTINHWPESSEPDASVKINTSTGRLVFAALPNGAVATLPRTIENDAAGFSLPRVRLDVTVTAEPFPGGASFGIFCRISPDKDSYAFYFMTNGVSAIKHDRNARKDTELSGISGGLTDPHLHIECSTSDDGRSVRMRLWEGERLVLEAEDNTDPILAGFPGGLRADLATGYGSDRFDVIFDDIAIYRL
jgi:hypothetical protein